MPIYSSLTQLIGNTPLLELTRYEAEHALPGRLLAKLESFNPLGSAKDRVAYAMIRDALAEGKISQSTVIIEPTSGNTGIGLAFAAATLGMKLILTMPETMSVERRKLVAALGAQVVLTEGGKGMQGAIDKAEELKAAYADAWIPQQFENPSNPKAHRESTARELLRDTGGNIAAFVAGIGTGGTLSGVGEVLKQQIPDVRIFGVEPADSPLLEGGKAGPHKLQGIGANFVPGNFNPSIPERIIPVTTQAAYTAAREVARLDGVLCGISSGAALAAATGLARQEEYRGKNIVVLLPDTGERYLSTDLYTAE